MIKRVMKKIPILAIIFPPLGLIMLLLYIIKKNNGD